MSTLLEELARSIKSNVESLQCNFVDPFPKEVQTDCSICLHLLKEPYVVGCCGYRFCKLCLVPTIKCCPLCKTYHFDKLPDKQLERLLNQRVVHCALQDSGCSWTGELCKLSSHVGFDNSSSKMVCEYLPIPCTFCNDYCRRMDLQSHQEICESRPSICTYCSYECLFKNLSTHLKICPKFPRPCKNDCCDDKHFTQAEMDAHLTNDCPLEMITCEYQFAGCGMRFLRKDLEEHMEGRLKLHLHLMTAKYEQLQDKEQNAPCALQKLKAENENLSEQITELSVIIEQLVTENEMLRESEERKREILHLTVTNLPPGVTKHNLKCVFGQFGTVDDIVLNKPHNAIINYSERYEYEKAIAVSSTRGINLLKHRLRVQVNYSA